MPSPFIDQVAEQILRFAGERTCSPPTVIHWAEVLPSALKPLAKRGVRALGAICGFHDGIWDGVYSLDDVRAEYLSRRDALVDYNSGIVFSHLDIMCNFKPLEKIVPTLAPLADDSNQAEIMDLLSHEQWYWPFYKDYSPDQALIKAMPSRLFSPATCGRFFCLQNTTGRKRPG